MTRPIKAEADLQSVLDEEDDAIVLYFASWCRYCKAFAPLFEKTRAAGDGATFLMRDLSDDDDPGWEARGVRVVPTVARYRRGEEVARLVGWRLIGIPALRWRWWVGQQNLTTG